MLYLSLFIALIVGWFVIKLVAGLFRIVLIVILLMVLAGIAMTGGQPPAAQTESL